MTAPAASIAAHQPVVRTLSENFAVSGNRKHTLAVRNWAKFRNAFSIFRCQTLFSRQTFLAIRQTFRSMVRFWEMTGRMMASAWYDVALSSRPVERSQTPLAVSCRPNGKPFMAKWQTFLAKHTSGQAQYVRLTMEGQKWAWKFTVSCE